MISKVSIDTLKFLISEEGFRSHAYQDSRGIWTIGYGFTYLNGHKVKQGDIITLENANLLLGITAQGFQNHVLALVKVQITQHQLTALVSFAYNEGWVALQNSVLLRKMNAKDYKGAADGFMQYTRAGNDRFILKGRRERERDLFLS